ncbi:zinc ribbon domain-containing protein [Streptomyces sp. NPDC057424]|uniref:NADase-type glycan-binding domain-containing protein n=1 Tax=Streptomyces sp. NPDC057424 TaxID=3346127 RepID=UPI00369C55A5
MTTPQNCADCGTRAQPGQSFCDACGSVLSWTDRPAGSPRTPEPAGATGPSRPSHPANGSEADGPPRTSGTADDPEAPGPITPPRTTSPTGGPGAEGPPHPARTPHSTAPTEGPGAHRPLHPSTPAEGPDVHQPAHSAGAARGESAGGSSAVSSTARAGSGADSRRSPSPASSPEPEPGWDAFARPDGGTGLPLTSRDRQNTDRTAQPGASTAATATTGEATGAFRPAPRHPAPRPGTPDDHASPPRTTGQPAPGETAPTQPVPPATQPHPHPRPADPHGMTDRARRLLVPVTDAEPRPAAEPSVAPVLPGRPAPQRPEAVRAPGEEHGLDGGSPCPWCATRNRPERHFCARCAMPMAGDGPAPARLPWWRRLGPFGSPETPWAGDRPRLRRAFDRVLSWLGIAIVLSLLIALAVNIPAGIQATRDHFAKRAPVSPDRYNASRSYPGHKPDLVFDKLNDTWWGPGVSQSGQGQYIEARFDQPTRLLDLIITPGTSTRADQLAKSALPHRILATITGKDGRTTTRRLTLDQGAGPQRRSFRVGEVSAVRFTIESAYGISAKKQVAIAEIEFFGPSSANNA